MITLINPANNQAIKELREDTFDSISEAYKAAKQAQKIWAKKTATERSDVIEKFWMLLETQAEACASLTSQETGRPVKQVLSEIKASEARIRFFLERFKTLMETKKVYEDTSVVEYISWEPLGVIANISAWNYPYFVGFNVIIPALLTGNAVLYKPSEFALMTGLKITELLEKAGLPQGVLSAVVGGGKIGAMLLDMPIDGAFFTGSYLTGKKIHEKLSSKLIKVGLELGGKDPCYVSEDVDISTVVAAVADGAFYNCGQSCCSVERVYVHESIYEAFVTTFVKEVETFKVGSPEDTDTYLGPLTRRPQIEVLEEQVDDALKKGAKLLTGGRAIEGSGNYFEPTVFSDVNHSMKLMREESFGPIIGIQKSF